MSIHPTSCPHECPRFEPDNCGSVQTSQRDRLVRRPICPRWVEYIEIIFIFHIIPVICWFTSDYVCLVRGGSFFVEVLEGISEGGGHFYQQSVVANGTRQRTNYQMNNWNEKYPRKDPVIWFGPNWTECKHTCECGEPACHVELMGGNVALILFDPGPIEGVIVLLLLRNTLRPREKRRRKGRPRRIIGPSILNKGPSSDNCRWLQFVTQNWLAGWSFLEVAMVKLFRGNSGRL